PPDPEVDPLADPLRLLELPALLAALELTGVELPDPLEPPVLDGADPLERPVAPDEPLTAGAATQSSPTQSYPAQHCQGWTQIESTPWQLLLPVVPLLPGVVCGQAGNPRRHTLPTASSARCFRGSVFDPSTDTMLARRPPGTG
ncbi:MAG: hypothetical protein ACREQ5_35035, partial [Candidatus Dormibacteria bacterium]